MLVLIGRDWHVLLFHALLFHVLRMCGAPCAVDLYMD